jgi:uncharacterized membrane protein YqjE
MTGGDGTQPPESGTKSLGEVVSEVSEKASLLVRQEVELAKAEVQQKVSRLAKGAAVGAVAGVFAVFALVMLLHGLAWFFTDLLDSSPWVGFAIVTGILLVLGALAGFLAYRAIKSGAPPTPDLAIEEAKRTRAALEHQTIERDQMERSKERTEALEEARS